MREIKFRAWDKEKKKMLFMSDGDFSNNHIWWLETNDCHDRFDIMQYTGLKDKNGREIYEGDIVKPCSKERPAEVCWSIPRAEWWLTSHSMGWSFGYYAQLRDDNDKPVIEVIGNIHSSPELLEKP